MLQLSHRINLSKLTRYDETKKRAGNPNFYNYISFSENICSAHTSYSHMLLFNSYAGYANCIKELFSMHFYTNWALK